MMEVTVRLSVILVAFSLRSQGDDDTLGKVLRHRGQPKTKNASPTCHCCQQTGEDMFFRLVPLQPDCRVVQNELAMLSRESTRGTGAADRHQTDQGTVHSIVSRF